MCCRRCPRRRRPLRTHPVVRARFGARAGTAGESTQADSALGCGPSPRHPDVTRLLDCREQPIGRHHDRKAFDCGDGALNEYLRRYARQNHESGGAKTFVAASSSEPARVLGYYANSPGTIEFVGSSISSNDGALALPELDRQVRSGPGASAGRCVTK